MTRAGRTLPISEVPNLRAGDQLTITPEMPTGEAVRYLLVAGFLRGAINPPPAAWFARTAAWKPKASLDVTVPEGAEEALVFLAPQTGGDYRTLVNTVRARPGAFVRAAQQLGQASLDRSRLDVFTADAARINQASPDRLQAATPLLARSLGVKIDQACLKKVTETQASCLIQDRDALVLDGSSHASTLQTLASGYSAELVRELSSTPWAGAGNYSPYLASIFDVVHLLDASRTAQYQYIAALGMQAHDRFSLLLNTPPSFSNPQSVLVAALPAIAAEDPPQLHPVNAAAVYCAGRRDVVVAMDGAPLVYSTGYAHDLAVRIAGKSGVLDLPARADPERGGIVVDTSAASGRTDLSDQGQLVGGWGFSPFEGPKLHFVTPKSQVWKAKGGARPSLIVGQESTLVLGGGDAACIDSIGLASPSGSETPLTWTASAADELTVHLPPKPAGRGDFTLVIRALGLKTSDVVPLGLYSKPSQIGAFVFHAGDHSALLTGEQLDEVQDVVVEGVRFTPGAAATNSDRELDLVAVDEDQGLQRLSAGEVAAGQARLKDGRVIPFHATVDVARPQVAIINRNIQVEPRTGLLAIRLGSQDAIPRLSKLSFAVRARAPTVFTGRETVQVETYDGAFKAELNGADGLMLQDPEVAVASLDLQKKFGVSAFGPLRFRIVKDELASEWQPLGILVRLPEITAIRCAARKAGGCTLKGANLFLISAVANSPTFDRSMTVPDGFVGDVLKVPSPTGGRLYLKLRDEPAVVDELLASPAE